MEVMTILWREFQFFKHRFYKITTSQLMTPLLYLITFGFGLKHVEIEGQPYLYFLIPGLLAMTTMRNSYSSVAMRVSITRLHEKSFESFIYSPTRMSHLTIGYILSGAFRGMYAGVFVVIVGLLSGADLQLSMLLVGVLMINAVIFSSIGFLAGISIDTHYDLNRFANMIITPMSFLCGAFYSVGGLPWYFKRIIEILPLTHTTRLIRRLMLGHGLDGFSLIISLVYMTFLVLFSIRYCYEEISD